MEYCLSIRLSFECQETLKALKEKEPEFSNPTSRRRFMLWREASEQRMKLVEFDLERAIASISVGQPAIPVWLDVIHQRLFRKLKQ